MALNPWARAAPLDYRPRPPSCYDQRSLPGIGQARKAAIEVSPMSDHQVIYSMARVGKIHPPNKQVLRDISLGFFRGAKIGVLGLNGAGKSTLLRIMAGVDEDYVGETTLSPGITRGFLPQEPQLDPEKTVRQVVVEAAGPVAAALDEYNQIGDRFAAEVAREHNVPYETFKQRHRTGWALDDAATLPVGSRRPKETP